MSEKIIRLLEIYTIIARKEYPSVKSLRERFHVSVRTLYRYLELINIVDAIEYDHEKEGYKFTHGDRIKKLILSQEELITLFSAGQAVSALGASFRENFHTLVNRMFLVSGKALPEDTGIIIKTPSPVLTDKMDIILKIISMSMNEKRSVEITYKSRQSKTTGARIVDPYGLIYYDGIWIMIGFCHNRKEIRSFAVDRVLEIKERYLYFEPRKDFDLNAYLSRTWGIIDGKEVNIKVKFNAKVADYILRKEKWHSSENRNKTIFCILFILFILVSATDLQAPEITAYDIFGFDPYRVAEDGSILDKDGAVKGWICGNTVHDTQWNVRR